LIVVVDASALVAIAMREPEAQEFADGLASFDRAVATTVNLFEAGLVLVMRYGLFDVADFHRWLAKIRIESSDEVSFGLALDAYLRYGRGVHRARLNLGDCFAYALAKALDAPLLYKGDDFAYTDVRSAL
jgi:ribonuclease VapC